ncbi:alpha/beta fold hydrolase [Microlunatus sp. Y2014]|uniref:alpha/beta fold hydrolase n=1 Tax=Microlunatus sp. Y2014 TaxID=3418488 RepID=UPI003DA70528
MQVRVNDVELYVDTVGDPADPPVLLIGITAGTWPDGLCAALIGRYVVRYDLRDLVTDASELLRALELGPTHVVGQGVGGFIAQLLALDHPEQVATLTLVSTRPVAPGRVDDDLPDHDATVMGQLFGRPDPDWTDRAAVIDHVTGSARLLAGSAGFVEQDVRDSAGQTFDRSRPTAAAQQASHLGTTFAKINCKPRWRRRLRTLAVPTLVVHGDEDPFFPYGNGVALAEEIPGAVLLTLPGIGQGVPRPVWPVFADAFLAHTDHAVDTAQDDDRP